MPGSQQVFRLSMTIGSPGKWRPTCAIRSASSSILAKSTRSGSNLEDRNQRRRVDDHMGSPVSLSKSIVRYLFGRGRSLSSGAVRSASLISHSKRLFPFFGLSLPLQSLPCSALCTAVTSLLRSLAPAHGPAGRSPRLDAQRPSFTFLPFYHFFYHSTISSHFARQPPYSTKISHALI